MITLLVINVFICKYQSGKVCFMAGILPIINNLNCPKIVPTLTVKQKANQVYHYSRKINIISPRPIFQILRKDAKLP